MAKYFPRIDVSVMPRRLDLDEQALAKAATQLARLGQQASEAAEALAALAGQTHDTDA